MTTRARLLVLLMPGCSRDGETFRRRAPAGRWLISPTRQPDGLTLRAQSWDDVWAACPEFDVPWRSIDFSGSQVHDLAVTSWGEHPDMPPRPTN
jgi:hypothetical protein